MRVESLVDAYLAHLRIERGLSANTLSAYGADLSRFCGFCTAHDVTDAGSIDPGFVSAYSTDLSKCGLGARTSARHLSALGGFMKFLVREGEIPSDPTALVRRPRTGRRLPRPLTPEGVLRLLAAPDTRTIRGLRDRALLSLAYAAGLRASELVGLKVGDVDFRRGVVAAFGKGQKRRLVPLGEVALESLEAYRAAREAAKTKPGARAQQSPLLFPTNRGKPLTRQTFWHVVRRWAKVAGLVGGAHPHRLRHSFATHLLAGGADLRSVQAMLGHADVATTEIYTEVTRDQVRAAHKKAHPRA